MTIMGIKRKFREEMQHTILYLLIFSLVTGISQGDSIPMSKLVDYQSYVQKADSLYSNEQFNQALRRYETASAVDDSDPVLKFKIAYSLYRTDQHDSSAVLFNKLRKETSFLPLYNYYFYLKSLWQNKNHRNALEESIDFIKSYPKRSLSDSLIIPVAEKLFADRKYDEARYYYQLARKKNINKQKHPDYHIQSAMCLYKVNNIKSARDEFYQILKRYAGARRTLAFSQWLFENEPQFYKEHFFNIVDVYFANGKSSSIRHELEEFVKTVNDPMKKEKGRYYLIKHYYQQGRYTKALYGFKNLLNDLKNKSLEPYIRLYFARIHYRLGNDQQAIDAYVEYAKRYPRRRISPEAVWKSAWIYEEMHQLDEALKLYQFIRKRWPRNTYAYESWFREGFTHYRLGNYEEADRIFNAIRFRKLHDSHVNRAQYWAALCREVNGDTITAKRLHAGLAENLWDDYYTMKSYLLHKAHLDSTLDMIETFKSSSRPLTFYGTGYANLLPHFKEAFRVRELLNDAYALAALEDIKLKADSRQEWIAVAEIYKKFGDYHRAFQMYDYINNKYYRDLPYTHKAFMLKERFPYFYEGQVSKYARRYNLESELIFGIIKQESVFDNRARSWANAFGLMQLIPATANDMARLASIRLRSNDQLYQPDLNVHLGSLYLKQLHNIFDGNKYKMLAAYNGGPHRVKRWQKLPDSSQMDVFIENIEFRETRNYVKRVMKNYWAYKLLNNDFQINSNDMIIGYLD
ncbi:MAG: transglycosylase SLT domain-containing protein [Caldithrix sp.]|nr:transglycosylase SLT domain-containing protein [Caldithrix sp.]